MGQAGISWVIQDHDPNLVDVLIGRVGELSTKNLKEALEDIKEKNPTAGEEVVKGGSLYRIPVRFPATRMVANGYVAIGDSAFMTIPMLGSGIASSMKAAILLTETIGYSMSRGRKASEEMFNVGALWRYQVKVFRSFGAEHCAVDAMKRGVLSMPDDEMAWMLGGSLLTNDEVCRLAKGRPLTINTSSALQKVKEAGVKNLGKMLELNKMLNYCHKAMRIGKNIPRAFHEKTVRKWEEKLAKAVRKTDNNDN